MEIMKLLKVGGKCDKYGEDAEGEGYPVVCGHLPLCARDVPLHSAKNSLYPFLHYIAIVTSIVITTNTIMMTKLTWRAETQSGSFPFANEKSRPPGSSSRRPPKLRQMYFHLWQIFSKHRKSLCK